MRIPLDYYRILGLPLAASEEQLRQAYSDRRQQLPRREYSQTAIESRKKLIERAYAVLSDPKQRQAYDRLYFAHAYGSNSDRHPTNGVVVENQALSSNGDGDSPQLGIEINQEEFVGALLLLQELGEYELVLKLGHPYLLNKNGNSASVSTTCETETSAQISTERADVILTVAVACLEVGREQWQQGHYENAAVSLETGEQLLAQEGLFPNVRGEIQSDIYRLRPYRILELLALPLEKVAERRQGLRLLQEILDERGGVDGTGDDQSGLSVDDFLRFIQQLRKHLTVAEQHKLFEAESKRPSAVATYLAVYALIARGFSQCQPAWIQHAKQMLATLSKRQDVHLEQSLCALFLGQTEEASRALELSQEYEALAFIRENSCNSPDLLPGLCLYAEHWLQNQVFPHFRDLVQKRASLKEYFADSRVQLYLEQLPAQAQTNSKEIASNPQPSQTKTNFASTGSHNAHKARTIGDRSTQTTASLLSNHHKPSSVEYSSQRFAAASTLNTAETVSKGANYYPNTTPPLRQRQPQSQRRRTFSGGPRGRAAEVRPASRRRRYSFGLRSKTRLLWVVLVGLAGGVGGVLLLWLLISGILGWLSHRFWPAPALQGEQLALQLNEPPLPIPDANTAQLPEEPLTPATAKQVIQTWLQTKALALGPNHEIQRLEDILAGPALSQWQLVAKQEQAANRYRKYEHNLKIESLETSSLDSDRATVLASVAEAASFYENGQLNQRKSYNETVRVRYSLIRQDRKWRIREMLVVGKLSRFLP